MIPSNAPVGRCDIAFLVKISGQSASSMGRESQQRILLAVRGTLARMNPVADLNVDGRREISRYNVSL